MSEQQSGSYTASEIAQHLHGEVRGDGSVRLTGFAPADTARPGDLTFAENEEYFARAEQSAAAAILVDGDFTSTRKVLIRVRLARLAFARVLPLFFPVPRPAAGVHPKAVVADSARVDPSAHVGPYCVVGANTRIGPRSILDGGVQVGPDCELGEDVHLFPNVVLYGRCRIGNRVGIHAGTVVGSDGFGYVFDGGIHHKVPQVGNVIIGDDVEIGANVTIDRGALGSTEIGRGTKIDNLVMIAHNVVVGEGCVLVAQVGIAGSTSLGNFVVLAGQVGLAGHLKLGDRASVGAKSGVMHNVPAGEKWWGIPAQLDRRSKRQVIALQQLPDIIQRFNRLEKQIEQLCSGSAEPPEPATGACEKP